MTGQRKAVLGSAAVLFGLWIALNYTRLATDQDFIIRLALGTLFSVLILFRPRRDLQSVESMDSLKSKLAHALSVSVAAALLGVSLLVGGIVARIHQAEWLGLVLILFGCLRWTLPRERANDIILSLLLLYWVHPLPGQVFSPLQFAMQRWSVRGAEWLLHCGNVRIWADDMMLRTAAHAFAVPESCSGMRIAVTVLLCTLGTGILFRFRWYEVVIAVAAGLAQVLVLNVLRVSFMIVMAPKMPQAWTETFLHDTAGIFLLAAIFLVQFEVSCLRAVRVKRHTVRTAIEDGRMEQPEDVSVLPPFWHNLLKLRWTIPLAPVALLAAAGLAAAVYRSRPYHRAMMIKDVADSLAMSNLRDAERASLAALEIEPDDSDLRTQRVKILLLRKKFKEALTELETIPEGEHRVFHVILRAWALMGLDRPNDAIALVDDLPEQSRTLPGVAIVRAEFAAVRDNTQAVVDNVVLAIRSPWMVRRVYALFPYLAARQQWTTIAQCHSGTVQYQNLTHTLIAVHAHMRTDRLSAMGQILDAALQKWPREPRFLVYVTTMAMSRPGSVWETRFAASLKTELKAFTSDELAVYMENSFRLSRPDLAWMLYNRLAELDPQDPALFLMPAQFGNLWFTFRKHHAGIAALGKYDTIDLMSFYLAQRDWPPAPLLDELTGTARIQKEYLGKCMDELARREKRGRLTPYLRSLRKEALRLAGAPETVADSSVARLRPPPEATDSELERTLDAMRFKIDAGSYDDAWALLNLADSKWPDEPAQVDCLARMAVAQPGSIWENRFEESLDTDLNRQCADRFAAYIENSFRISRPDLAWRAYSRLQAVDPEHPALFLAPVQFRSEWFVFRRYRVGIPALSRDEKINLERLYLCSRDWSKAPLADKLATDGAERIAAGFLEESLNELERRKKRGDLSLRMQMMYPTALGLAGRYAEAHACLDEIARQYPDQKREVLFKHAVFYDREGRWPQLYEVLRDYCATETQPRLAVTLMQINALMNLNFGVYALTVAERAASTFPGSPESHKATAAIWAALRFPEEALFALKHTDDYLRQPIIAQILWDSRRYAEAERVQQAYGHELRRGTAEARQPVLLPKAEAAIARPPVVPLTEEEWAQGAGNSGSRATPGVSPFVDSLSSLIADWHRTRGSSAASDPDSWLAAARDETEQAVALTELTILLMRIGRHEEAETVARRALELMPDSSILRRILITLSGGDDTVVNEAFRTCPSDPEIWLAHLVVKTRRDGPGEWGLAEILGAIKADRFSVGTIVRAGEFMQRHDMPEAADEAARWAVDNAQGLLPAYVLGLRFALAAKDWKRAMSCAREAAVNALDPWPFYKVIAELEIGRLSTEPRNAEVLEKLRTRFPDDPRWSRELGNLYLRTGQPKSALAVLETIMSEQPQNVDLRTLLLAAEAARQSSEFKRSTRILEAAYAMYPANRIVLNNLVYSLAFERETLPRAKELLPKLLDMWGDSLPALDTAAMVYRCAGDTTKAKEYLEKATHAVGGTDPLWLRMNPMAVDIDAYLGEYDYNVDTVLRELERAGPTAYGGGLVPVARKLSRDVRDRAGEGDEPEKERKRRR